jgi:UDP-N-acetylmuramoylalanine--D-glutamate ligase
MSSSLTWPDLVGLRVGLWGLGAEGTASRRKLASLSKTAPILVEDTPHDAGILALHEGGMDALGACDVVIKSPGVSRYRPEVAALESAGAAVVGGLGLWLEGVDRDRVVCVTGTKGKSTTVSILGHLLTRLGRTCFIGGNLGSPPFDPDAPTDVDVWAIEVSSFQVMDLWSAPPVVAVTSLHPDHLDWHGTAERYFTDKLSLCTKPGALHVIANGADALLREHASLLGDPEWVMPGGDAWIGALGLRGEHNRMNALIAARCLHHLGIDDDLEMAAAGFEGLPSRLRSVATVGGVEFVDDSLSTNVLPTMAAVSVFPERRLALLVGGYDRQIDYAPLAHHLRERTAPTLVLTMPDNGDRIGASLKASTSLDASTSLEVERGDDLDTAVRRAWEWAQPDGVVLLSPAAPSFGRFADYRARSEAFMRAVRVMRSSDAASGGGG